MPLSWQKLLYTLLNPQQWVSVTGNAMVQSYEPEKMRRCTRDFRLRRISYTRNMKPGRHTSVRQATGRETGLDFRVRPTMRHGGAIPTYLEEPPVHSPR